MDKIELVNEEGKTFQAEILFTYYSKDYDKNYLVYVVDDELVASSYTLKDNKYILNNDLTDAEFDMLDIVIERKLGEIND